MTSKGDPMMRRYIADDYGRFSLDLAVEGPVLEEAVEQAYAEEVLKCAVIMALSALAQGGPWPQVLLREMAAFMMEMKNTLIEEEYV